MTQTLGTDNSISYNKIASVIFYVHIFFFNGSEDTLILGPILTNERVSDVWPTHNRYVLVREVGERNALPRGIGKLLSIALECSTETSDSRGDVLKTDRFRRPFSIQEPSPLPPRRRQCERFGDFLRKHTLSRRD